MQVYINGQLRPEAEIESDWYASELPKAAGFSSTLELGQIEPGQTWAPGTMWMDELLIWQEKLPCDDVLRLYHAYQ